MTAQIKYVNIIILYTYKIWVSDKFKILLNEQIM